ncbi:MAG: hypothetical protein A3H61_04350 [Candidatus Jacksonbacteria bacterium RIFCSPLOWO2_02_FULL_44_20]|uniref:Bacterial type II secretion system protein E domain-containing protein n=1 Tax=Candidatus Jacksonbacteria bacterium RIFCSPLOWO2_02_FULL_44_20 TaxID=1798460 RepID=A0A1G2ABA2_9BACT|nr:MAG: hypothetical protein A3E05_03640 [Candidatus Jacksonbacteria bacterium RIFCSPHIGHO2_12_FULL_44_12]OGY73390.1 MAG: hypothetical protein A3H07_00520 [Candidatus Jacksonbacteria bacterium RIFCSPLOWO2_12_FULL_44_15b]OGY74134.1 MAG: hypothetical protein A3H61_04350 [Candidatus Jacksonbacteria bacterium RIFCSPLOWO2_02_FULL_44_20]HCA67209.1 type IV pili twitching motility protein PilT [Candidatus Jacksonbacteria bacterium]HCE87247.1 type IV pili twitching motility protein PilT [Candidatus Jack
MDNFFHHIIEEARKNNCSDIHIGVGYAPVIRVDGRITYLSKLQIATKEIMEKNIREFFGESAFTSAIGGREVDIAFSHAKTRFRVNIYRERRGLNVAMRVIPEEIPTIESLGLLPPYGETLKQLVEAPYGLILITGPTGCGKSTTLAAMIGYINSKRTEHIITLEDPIEYLHENNQCLVKQREVGDGEDSASFSQALRSALREDPDVILVGEMRDQDTMSLAVSAAETGHLVLSTVHTNNTYQAVNRIIDVFPGDRQDQIRGQLAQNLVGVISQRLIPKRDGGRVVVAEFLINTSAVKTQIRDNKLQMIPNTIKTGREEGMILLSDYVKMLIENEVIERKEGEKHLVE